MRVVVDFVLQQLRICVHYFIDDGTRVGVAMVVSSVTRVTARKRACARTGHELRLPGTTVSLLLVLMLYHRLASDVDMMEEAELRELEGGEARGGASRRLGMHHLPTVTGVQVGCTTAQDAMRMGAVFVVPVHCGEVHRDSTDMVATVVGADVVEEHGAAPSSVTSSRPRKTKRMDRRLTHWQCAFCRHEMLLSEGADKCSRCNGTRQHLGDADAEEREKARRQSREKEAHGRKLNARWTGTECVPRAAQGVFEVARHDALVRWETTML